MRIEQFYFFLEVAEQKSILAASEKLFVTPQYISKSLHQLEKELDVKLYTRTRYGIKLTNQGETAYKMIKHICDGINNLKTAFHQDNAPNDIYSLSLLCSADMAQFVTDHLPVLKEFYGELIIDMDVKEANDILRILKEQDYDLVFTCLRSNAPIPSELTAKYTFQGLLEDKLGVFLDQSSPLFFKQSISAKILETTPISVFVSNNNCKSFYVELLNEVGVYPQIAFTSSSPQNCTSYSRKNNAYNIGTKVLTNTTYRQRAEAFRFIPFAENITLLHGVFVNQKLTNDQVITNFLKNLKSSFDSLKK